MEEDELVIMRKTVSTSSFSGNVEQNVRERSEEVEFCGWLLRVVVAIERTYLDEE